MHYAYCIEYSTLPKLVTDDDALESDKRVKSKEKVVPDSKLFNASMMCLCNERICSTTPQDEIIS